MAHVLPTVAAQREFAHLLIDGFVDLVLEPLARDPRFAGRYRYIDLRTLAPDESDWFDEMHPTGATFHRLSKTVRGGRCGRRAGRLNQAGAIRPASAPWRARSCPQTVAPEVVHHAEHDRYITSIRAM
jgi:hypothetical protein